MQSLAAKIRFLFPVTEIEESIQKQKGFAEMDHTRFIMRHEKAEESSWILGESGSYLPVEELSSTAVEHHQIVKLDYGYSDLIADDISNFHGM